MRKKRGIKRKRMLHLMPESSCNIHPPLPFGSKHFSLDLPRLPKGRCSQLGFQTEQQIRRKKERREKRRKRDKKIKSSSESKTEDEEDLKCLRSRGDESSTHFDETDFLPSRPPTPEKKLKKGFGCALEYVPFEKKVADNKTRKMPPIKKDQTTEVKQVESTSASSSEGSKSYGARSKKTSANPPPPKMAEREDLEGKMQKEMQKNLMTIKEEKEEETPHSKFEEAGQAEEGSGPLYVDDNGPRFKNPDHHDGTHFEAEYSWNETNAGLTTLMKAAEGGNKEGNSSSFLNQPRGTSDKENNKIATANPGIITKQPQGPKIVLSKSCTPKHSKEKTDETRYGVQTFIEGGDRSNTKSRMDVRSSNRADLPPLKIRASFSETLQEMEFSERRRKKKKAKRTKNEEDTSHRVSSTTSELGRHHFRPSDSETSVSKTREEFNVSQKISDEDENTSNRAKTKDFTTLHFCYEVFTIQLV